MINNLSSVFLCKIFVFFPEKQTKTKFGEKSKIFDSKRNAKNANLPAKERFAKKFRETIQPFRWNPTLYTMYNTGRNAQI